MVGDYEENNNGKEESNVKRAVEIPESAILFEKTRITDVSAIFEKTAVRCDPT